MLSIMSLLLTSLLCAFPTFALPQNPQDTENIPEAPPCPDITGIDHLTDEISRTDGGVPRAYTYHLALLPTIAFDCRVALDLLKDVDDETSVFALSSQLPANGYSYIAPLEPRETVRKRFKFARYYRDADFTWAHVAIMLDYMIQAVGSTVGRNKGLKVTASNLTGWLGWARLSDVQDRYPERCQGGKVFEETE